MSTPASIAVCLLFAVADLSAQSPFFNFESPPVHPIRISPSGARLFAVNTPDNRLVVWTLVNPDRPALLKEIPVGLEPVSVTPRSDDEVWVANHLSDSISIVSVSLGRVVATLRVKDEPTDIAFAGGYAFVTATASDAVRVFDATTRAEVATIPIFGKDPRGLAVDAGQGRVYVLINRSGNRTTILPDSAAPPPPPPGNPSLPPAPQRGLIVSVDDPAWSSQFSYSLPDNDVAEIDAQTFAITRYFTGVGTTNFDLAVHPASGDVFVANTEARNVVRFEPVLRGHCIDSRITRITTGTTPSVTSYDLNPGINYLQLPNLPAKATALAEPTAVVIDGTTSRIYVAAQGTDRVGILDLSGNVLGRIEIGPNPGAIVNASAKRGPRGLAIHPSHARLYVFNRLSHTISVIDTVQAVEIAEVQIGSFDPTPPAISAGRRFLYDARLSGNGTMSCASCHVDGDSDGLAWDLGDPGGSTTPAPVGQSFPLNQYLADLHPMKGPMVTQTLSGLTGVGPLHWQGDRPTFQDFNPAFDKLLGNAQLPAADMNLFAQFGTSIVFPPNPNQPLDRAYATAPAQANQAAGFSTFTGVTIFQPVLNSTFTCVMCHVPPTSTSGLIVGTLPTFAAPQMKIPQLRNLYRKTGFVNGPGPSKTGFGFTHDGHLDTLDSFLSTDIFAPWPASLKDDLVAFLLAFDTGTAPTVGYQATVNVSNWNTPSSFSDWILLRDRAIAGDIDVVAQGLLDGSHRGLLFHPQTQTLIMDRVADPPLTVTNLEVLLAAGQTALTFMGVPVGTGARVALDRNGDGVLNGDAQATVYGAGTAGCNGVPSIGTNSEPRLGNAGFAVIAENAPASTVGFFAVALSPAVATMGGITVLVDLATPAALLLAAATDSTGTSTFPAALPADPGLAGVQIFVQFAWIDACGPQGLSATPGLKVRLFQ